EVSQNACRDLRMVEIEELEAVSSKGDGVPVRQPWSLRHAILLMRVLTHTMAWNPRLPPISHHRPTAAAHRRAMSAASCRTHPWSSAHRRDACAGWPGPLAIAHDYRMSGVCHRVLPGAFDIPSGAFPVRAPANGPLAHPAGYAFSSRNSR